MYKALSVSSPLIKKYIFSLKDLYVLYLLNTEDLVVNIQCNYCCHIRQTINRHHVVRTESVLRACLHFLRVRI